MLRWFPSLLSRIERAILVRMYCSATPSTEKTGVRCEPYVMKYLKPSLPVGARPPWGCPKDVTCFCPRAEESEHDRAQASKAPCDWEAEGSRSDVRLHHKSCCKNIIAEREATYKMFA